MYLPRGVSTSDNDDWSEGSDSSVLCGVVIAPTCSRARKSTGASKPGKGHWGTGHPTQPCYWMVCKTDDSKLTSKEGDRFCDPTATCSTTASP
jgi:hypothetical protein